jgi:hypothetical protein
VRADHRNPPFASRRASICPRFDADDPSGPAGCPKPSRSTAIVLSDDERAERPPVYRVLAGIASETLVLGGCVALAIATHHPDRKDEPMKKALELLFYIVAIIVVCVTCFIWFILSIVCGKPRL